MKKKIFSLQRPANILVLKRRSESINFNFSFLKIQVLFNSNFLNSLSALEILYPIFIQAQFSTRKKESKRFFQLFV